MIRDYLSASAVNLFLNCNTSYFLKYVMGLNIDDTELSYARYGTLVHEICENICNGKYLFLDEAVEEFEERFPTCCITPEGYYDEGITGIARQWEFFDDFKITPIGAEVEFSVKPFENIPRFFGFIDLVYRDDGGNLIVRDYKSSKPYTDKQLEHQIQPYFYSEACLEMYGELPKYFEFDFIRFGEKKTIVTDETFLEFQRVRMQGIWKKMEAKAFKSNWNPFFCNSFCECRSSCPLWIEKKGMM